jgi:uncharacterized membrane protein
MALTQPEFWILLLLLGLLLAGLARRLALRWPPALILRVAFIALILFGLFLPRGELARQELPIRQVLLVDQSDSLSPAASQQIRQEAQAWQEAGENRLVVAFGAQAQAILKPSDPWPDIDGRASNAQSALQMAGELLGQAQGRVILASDGLAADPSAIEAVIAQLKSHGDQLDVLQLASRDDPSDGSAGALWAPSNLWAGTPFDVVLPVHLPPGGGKLESLQLKINGQDSGLTAEPLQGDFYRFHVPAQPKGIATLEASARFVSNNSQPDPFLANNSAFATLQVFDAPRVLFVTAQSNADEVKKFIDLLRQNSLRVDVLSPKSIPTELPGLNKYRVIFLHNLLSNQISQEQMMSLQVFASRLAGGLIFLGGRNSYTLGGYQGSLLETMLPVKLEPPPRSERPPIAFTLVLDRSGSMGVANSEGVPQPIALAREAAMRAIEAMQPKDYLGVLTFNDEFTWDVPLQELGSGLTIREAEDSVSRVQSSGSTKIYAALQEAVSGMRNLPQGAPASRHILLLSDGQSFDGNLPAFRSLAQDAQAQGITISSIALGEDADKQTLSAIAEAGKGRYYNVSQASDLPRILIYESQAARSENIQAGQTSLKLGEGDHPILSGMNTAALPILDGYNALSSKSNEGAEDILVSANFGDPVLSAWQYGLGRVVAWTSDIGEEWVSNWSTEAEGSFWSQVVRYALADPALGPAQVTIQVEDTGMAVEAAIQNSAGDPVNLAQVSFTYAAPDGQTHTFSLPQVSPGSYRLELPRPSEGAYRGVLSFSAEDGQRQEIPASFAVNPPAEWQPSDPSMGAARLSAWAKSAGGQILSPEAIQSPDKQPAASKSQPIPGDRWRWLLLAMVLYWPLEIALRRRWLPWTRGGQENATKDE